MKGKYLITTSSWFIAPDGQQYRAVWGDVKILEDSFLGIKTNRNSVNWFAKIGSENNHIIIAGCQIFYAVRCESKPALDKVRDWHLDGSGFKEASTPSRIYFTK